MRTRSREHSCPACGRAGHLLVTVSTHEHYLCPACGTCYTVTIAELPTGTYELDESALEPVEPVPPEVTAPAPFEAAQRIRPAPTRAPVRRTAFGTPMETQSFKSAPRRASRAPHGAARPR